MDIKTGALEPAWTGTLERSDGTSVDLTGATVYFRMADSTGSVVIDTEADVLDASAGTVQHEWVDGETDTEGRYSVEIHVIDSDGKPRIFPDKGVALVNIFDDVG